MNIEGRMIRIANIRTVSMNSFVNIFSKTVRFHYFRFCSSPTIMYDNVMMVEITFETACILNASAIRSIVVLLTGHVVDHWRSYMARYDPSSVGRMKTNKTRSKVRKV